MTYLNYYRDYKGKRLVPKDIDFINVGEAQRVYIDKINMDSYPGYKFLGAYVTYRNLSFDRLSIRMMLALETPTGFINYDDCTIKIGDYEIDSISEKDLERFVSKKEHIAKLKKNEHNAKHYGYFKIYLQSANNIGGARGFGIRDLEKKELLDFLVITDYESRMNILDAIELLVDFENKAQEQFRKENGVLHQYWRLEEENWKNRPEMYYVDNVNPIQLRNIIGISMFNFYADENGRLYVTDKGTYELVQKANELMLFYVDFLDRNSDNKELIDEFKNFFFDTISERLTIYGKRYLQYRVGMEKIIYNKYK
ncbi:hypothetical protein KQI68_06390 [Peptoniphilus sp. MSJ-1]|uniref:Uncharacterized protein n=1 Tax=Peptoniphilus ovalis TaxID=2841503 RepID=A0ABS6FJT2_9FIRM|nr:hypothetical protein [Peptoniphilus ovalis]MBU5669465.1 hypothetical protein [Peptoniphilus ovalis]